ncbi:MAG: hypothetical protein AB9861_02020 [Methanosarcina sp.]
MIELIWVVTERIFCCICEASKDRAWKCVTVPWLHLNGQTGDLRAKPYKALKVM